MSSKPSFRRVLIGAAVMMMVTAAAFARGGSERPGTAAGTAGTESAIEVTVEFIDGDVNVDGAPAEFGMAIAPGSVVTVGPNSTCEIQFGKNIIRVYADSSLAIDLSNPAQAISVSKGAIAAVFDRVKEVSTGATLDFRTPTTVGGVRGTVFYVRVESPDSTFVCICNGTVGLAAAAGDSATAGAEQVVTAAHHSGLRFIRSSDGSIRSEVPEMAYHTDEEMQSVAAKIGVTIDWQVAK